MVTHPGWSKAKYLGWSRLGTASVSRSLAVSAGLGHDLVLTKLATFSASGLSEPSRIEVSATCMYAGMGKPAKKSQAVFAQCQRRSSLFEAQPPVRWRDVGCLPRSPHYPSVAVSVWPMTRSTRPTT
jgi:hypothetical protein